MPHWIQTRDLNLFSTSTSQRKPRLGLSAFLGLAFLVLFPSLQLNSSQIRDWHLCPQLPGQHEVRFLMLATPPGPGLCMHRLTCMEASLHFHKTSIFPTQHSMQRDVPSQLEPRWKWGSLLSSPICQGVTVLPWPLQRVPGDRAPALDEQITQGRIN